ncbi:MAG: LD-carboxypeptidase [Bacteroidia bacterium]|nr:LD-carboxypeptidase [Bacteroidia bacterium]
MHIPPFLTKGDTIGICSPARKISLAEVEPAIQTFKNWGLNVKLSDNLFNEHHQFSGTDEQRAFDLQNLINDKQVNAIICARGGYGSVRVLDKVDFSVLKKNPKWIIGFSDITALHAHINKNQQVSTLHATMPINFTKSEQSVNSLQKLLFGKDFIYPINTHPFNKNGIAHGKIIGGNLSVLYSLAATNSDIDTTGKILFLEDLDEYLYHIDRMMMQLKRSGKLNNLSGLMLGSFTDSKDNAVPFGMNPYEIIKSHVDEYNYPVCFGFPAGHQELNTALYFGVEAKLSISNEKVSLDYPHIIS